MRWEDLRGTRLVRFCSRCNLNVYNLAEMPPDRVKRLVRKREGRLCGRLYLRGDRTATARPCPAWGLRRTVRIALTTAAILLLAACSWLLRAQARMNRSALPPIVKDLAEWIDPEPQSTVIQVPVVLGRLCPAPSPPPQKVDTEPQ
jgi:hypothetical protein